MVAQFDGMSDGLNRESRNASPAVLLVTNESVIVSWMKLGLRPKLSAERFVIADIIDIQESDDPLPGVAGAIERKNATQALGRAMGNSSTRPTVTLQTRRGDFSLFFENKKRGEARRATVAVSDLIGPS